MKRTHLSGFTLMEAMIASALEEHGGARITGVLDCGAAPGLVLGALRQGLACVRFDGPEEAGWKLADIARQMGAAVVRELPPALDLEGVRDAEAACRDWIGA